MLSYFLDNSIHSCQPSFLGIVRLSLIQVPALSEEFRKIKETTKTAVAKSHVNVNVTNV